jgi:hypothetical protein
MVYFNAMKAERIRNIIVVALLILCAVELHALARDTKEARLNEDLRASRDGHHMLDRQKPEVADIDTWMTFEYINTVFKLPTEYLKNTLGIVDTQYPKIHIGKYARENHIDPSLVLENVKAAVAKYPTAAATSI